VTLHAQPNGAGAIVERLNFVSFVSCSLFNIAALMQFAAFAARN